MKRPPTRFYARRTPRGDHDYRHVGGPVAAGRRHRARGRSPDHVHEQSAPIVGSLLGGTPQKLNFFPSGGWGSNWVGNPDYGTGVNQPGGWIYQLLPYMERGQLARFGQGRQRDRQFRGQHHAGFHAHPFFVLRDAPCRPGISRCNQNSVGQRGRRPAAPIMRSTAERSPADRSLITRALLSPRA